MYGMKNYLVHVLSISLLWKNIGYLTRNEEINLKNELLRQGFENEKLNIYCTDKRQTYGSPIYLSVNYIYTLELPIVGEREIEMNINRESVSKR